MTDLLCSRKREAASYIIYAYLLFIYLLLYLLPRAGDQEALDYWSPDGLVEQVWSPIAGRRVLCILCILCCSWHADRYKTTSERQLRRAGLVEFPITPEEVFSFQCEAEHVTLKCVETHLGFRPTGHVFFPFPFICHCLKE